MRARPATLDLRVVAGSATLLLVLAGLSAAIMPPSVPGSSGSSFNPSPDGTKAAFELLREAGWTAERSVEPLTALRHDPGRTVLVLTDPQTKPSVQDRQALARFVSGGGIVVASGSSSAAFLSGITSHERAAASPGALREFAAAAPTLLAPGVATIRMPSPAGVRADQTTWVQAFASDGEPGVLIARSGRGGSVWIASTFPLSNAGIAQAGHLQLLLNLLGPRGQRHIVWDEHYHGFGRTFWSYVAGTPIAWGLAQLGLIVALAVFAVGRRLGPIRPAYVVPRTSPLEFVEMMGGLYGRARATGSALATARSYARRRLAAAAGLSAGASGEALSMALSRRFGIAPDRTRAALAEGSGHVTERDLVTRVAGLQTIVRDATTVRRRAPAPAATDGSP